MRLEKVKTPGLAHLSYFLSAGGEAAIIDPRRDIDVYLELARNDGAVIKHVFETHLTLRTWVQNDSRSTRETFSRSGFTAATPTLVLISVG